LVGLAAAFDHRLRYRAEETVDDENRVERQPIFREPGRAAHIHEHADEVALLADMRGTRGACCRGLRQEYLKEGEIRLRPELAGEADGWIRTGPDTVEHEGFAVGRHRQ
jgi:hypothetical protein